MAFGRIQVRAPARVYAWYAGALALAVALFLAFGSGASAKDARRSPEPEARTDARPPAPGPARFFTINEIMARRDSDPAGAGGRTAAVGQPDTANDAEPAERGIPGSRLRLARGQALGPEPFGLYAFRAPDGLLWMKWRDLEADLKGEAQALADCRATKICSEGAAHYLAIVEEIRAKSDRAQLETANRLVNGALRYVSDAEQHGISDRWQAPLQALAAGRGDCEEYAIAKYAALREAGVPEADLRLVLVRDTAIRIDHAVLAARFAGRWVVLDNRRGAVAETEDLRHYQPLYALAEDGVKLFAAPYAMWGEGGAEYADWTLRGAVAGPDPAIDEWRLRGSDEIEP
ncbi:MAG: transglutaminase-like cysteine peptidase, partial [Xanthobacteraceae bacterium]